MAARRARGFELDGTYIHVTDGAAATALPVTPDFWSGIDSNADLRDGRLLCAFPMNDDWPSWEMHPAGDEIVVQLTGAMDLVLRRAGRDRIVELRAGTACIVPRGVWHRGIVRQPGSALFLTRGKGTRHRPIARRRKPRLSRPAG